MPVSKRPTNQPYWKSDCGRAVVYVGDNLHVTERMEPDLFHAVVTDPPYGLEFDVGEVKGDWDAPWKHTQARERRYEEMSDPVKAKYLHHNVEYVRDGQAFQEWFTSRAESILRVAKPGAHLLSFGGTRMWHRMACAVEDAGWEIRDTLMWVYGSGYPKGRDISKAIDEMLGAKRRVVGVQNGVPDTTKVRPGFTGAAHMGEASGSKRDIPITEAATDAAKQWEGWNTTLKPAFEPILLARKEPVGTVAQCALDYGTGGVNVGACEVNGRWPANFVIDASEEVISQLPEGASRYFYTAKSGESDRPHGRSAVSHPTVKPLDLMKYLVRLVCAPGGMVLDPFMGSGSTGCAAIAEGMRFVGIEQSPEYADIAVGRMRLMLESAPPLVELKTWGAGRVEKQNAPPPPQVLR